MPIRRPVSAVSAFLTAALLVGCAEGSSSVTHPAGTVPVTPQGNAPGTQSVGSSPVHSGVRRTRSAPTCSGSGSAAFVGGPGSATYGLNYAAGSYAVVAGGDDNQACDGWAVIGGGYSNAVSGSGEDGFIGSGEFNVVTGSDLDAVVVGGYHNQVSINDAAIVGGYTNSVAGEYALIGGGYTNTITSAGSYGAIAGGLANNLSGEYGFIGGGENNTVSGKSATIGGGYDSLASGAYATVPGGYANYATGTGSFAAGVSRMPATPARSCGAMTRAARSASNDRIERVPRPRIGRLHTLDKRRRRSARRLAAGSGTWASASDRDMKANVAPIDDRDVLDKVTSLPISRWSYKSERGVRHVGPMAQDFYAAFRVGEDDKHITSIDEDGVALAAIKALHRQLRAQETSARAAITVLHAENARLRARLAAAMAAQAGENASLHAEVAAIRAELHATR